MIQIIEIKWSLLTIVWSAQSHYLDHWWLDYWCIYASLNINELINLSIVFPSSTVFNLILENLLVVLFLFDMMDAKLYCNNIQLIRILALPGHLSYFIIMTQSNGSSQADWEPIPLTRFYLELKLTKCILHMQSFFWLKESLFTMTEISIRIYYSIYLIRGTFYV